MRVGGVDGVTLKLLGRIAAQFHPTNTVGLSCRSEARDWWDGIEPPLLPAEKP